MQLLKDKVQPGRLELIVRISESLASVSNGKPITREKEKERERERGWGGVGWGISSRL